MNTKPIFSLLLSCLYAINGLSQIAVEGKVTNQNLPVEFATVVLFKAADTNQVIEAVSTDSIGRFVVHAPTKGAYFLKILSEGNNTQLQSFSLKEDEQNHLLKTIELVAAPHVLKNIEITAQKNMMKKTATGFIINTANNITQAGGTATDLLRNTPSVVVDEDGNITIRGKAPLILVNNRNSSLTSTDRIPASSIESIEIINNPNAKYDADADGGIINIVLKKNNGYGTNGSVATGGGMGDYGRVNSAFILNRRQGKWNIGLGYDNRFAGRSRNINAERTNFNLFDEYDLTQNRHDNRVEQTQNLKLNADYNPNKKNSFSIELISNKNGNDNHETLASQLNKKDGSFNFDNTRHSDEIERSTTLEGSLLYQHKFDNPKKKLLINLSSSLDYERQNTDINTQPFDSSGNIVGNALLQHTHDFDDNKSSNLKLDYEQPLGNHSMIETGLKGNFRHTDADFLSAYLVNNVYEMNPKASNVFHFNEQVDAAYFNFKSTIGKLEHPKLKYEIGIRAEQTSNNGKSNSDTTSFSNNYLHFFPSANLAYYVHDDDFFKYSFSRRINRPGLGQLNPFIDITDSLNPHGGNPFLKPELINSIELGYNKEWHHFSATSTLFYRYATDIIRPFVSVDSHGVALALPMNYGNATTYGFEEICSISPIRWYGCNASISFYEQRIDGSNVSTDALSNYFSWYLKTIHNFSLGKGCRLQCIANYNSPIATPQGTRIAVYNADLGLQKKFKNQASALGIVLTDIFNTQKNGFTAVNSTFNFHRTSKADTRAVLITFTHSFKTAVKEDMLENKFENE